MQMRLVAIIFSIVFSVLPAVAQGRSPSVEGSQLCGTWLRERQARRPQLHLYEKWVVKYITGDDWADIARPDLLGWVDNYCREHPVESVRWAAEELVIELIFRTLLPKFAAGPPVKSIKAAETQS